jgi:hypothetical protein
VSFVHTLLSLQVSVGCVHVPPLHTSVVQKSPSLAHEAVLLVYTQPVEVLHESFVHTLLSLQVTALPPPQLPPPHTSPVVQALPSLQDTVLFVNTQPVDALHESVVHTLLSLQVSGVPAVQTPVWQTSAPLHTVESAQEVPFATFE